MICERCGEITETFMTDKYGELCERCQREAEAEQQGGRVLRRQSEPIEE